MGVGAGIGPPRWVEWTYVVPLIMPVMDDDTSTLLDGLTPFHVAKTRVARGRSGPRRDDVKPVPRKQQAELCPAMTWSKDRDRTG